MPIELHWEKKNQNTDKHKYNMQYLHVYNISFSEKEKLMNDRLSIRWPRILLELWLMLHPIATLVQQL